MIGHNEIIATGNYKNKSFTYKITKELNNCVRKLEKTSNHDQIPGTIEQKHARIGQNPADMREKGEEGNP